MEKVEQKEKRERGYVEFHVQGEIEPHDVLRLETGIFPSCGTARFGMCLNVYREEYGGWNGGVIDHQDLRKIRDAIDAHLAVIDGWTEEERNNHLPFYEQKGYDEKTGETKC